MGPGCVTMRPGHLLQGRVTGGGVGPPLLRGADPLCLPQGRRNEGPQSPQRFWTTPGQGAGSCEHASDPVPHARRARTPGSAAWPSLPGSAPLGSPGVGLCEWSLLCPGAGGPPAPRTQICPCADDTGEARAAGGHPGPGGRGAGETQKGSLAPRLPALHPLHFLWKEKAREAGGTST